MNTQTDQDTGNGGSLITAQEAAERRLAETAPATAPDGTRDDGPLMAVIQKVASDPNFDVEKLRELRAIQKEWDAEQAKKAYDDALSRAQAAMPIVTKNKHTNFGEGEKEVDYWYADYGALVDAVKPALTAEGFSFDHKITQEVVGEGSQRITVTCILKRGGHSESVTMFAPPEGSPGMNVIQKIKSTTTYLRRATLEAVCGAATEDDDDDGRGAAPSALIGTSELAFLNAEIAELGADRDGFLEYLKVERLEDLPASDFAKAKAALEAKRRKLAEGGTTEAKAPAEDAEPEPHEIVGAG